MGKKMSHQQIITHLRVNGDVFKYLFLNLSDEQARWKPGADRWSLLEVINHLYDIKSAMTSFNCSFRFSGFWVLASAMTKVTSASAISPPVPFSKIS